MTTDFDITETLTPKSDQQNYEDYLTGPKTVTISGVTRGSADQPVVVQLEEFPGRPFKPSKGMRRVLAKAWGPKASAWVGRRLTLFGDPTALWAGKPTGGVRISHMSHINKAFTMPLAISKGKRVPFTVQPLPDAPTEAPALTDDQILACQSVDTLRGMWHAATARQRDMITARKSELDALTPNDPARDPNSTFEAGEPA